MEEYLSIPFGAHLHYKDPTNCEGGSVQGSAVCEAQDTEPHCLFMQAFDVKEKKKLIRGYFQCDITLVTEVCHGSCSTSLGFSAIVDNIPMHHVFSRLTKTRRVSFCVSAIVCSSLSSFVANNS